MSPVPADPRADFRLTICPFHGKPLGPPPARNCEDCRAAIRKTLDESREVSNERMETVLRLVDEQAEDEGLWFVAATATEAYLQQELRRLHAAIEGHFA